MGALVSFAAFAFMPATARSENSFLSEDWTVTYEPTHPTYWGGNWGEENFLLPYRALQRGKRWTELRWANNWRFESKRGGAGGIALRAFSFGIDFGMFSGLQNLHHALGHDAAARELSRSYGLGDVPDRFNQVLPRIFGGSELAQSERNTFGGGPDSQTQYMSQPMQEEMQFSFEAAKDILARPEINGTEALNFFFLRVRALQDGITETGTIDQDFADYQLRPSTISQVRSQLAMRFMGRSRFSTDFTHYVHQLNGGRYGVRNVSDYKIGMDDIKMTYYYQLLDPVFWLAAWKVGKEVVYEGNVRTSIPMLRLAKNVSYLPSFRTYFSPFGIEYTIDHLVRWRGMLFDIYATRGDNRYEKRIGFGLSMDHVEIWQGITIGAFFDWSHQPNLSRILNRSPLAAGEFGQRHQVFNFGGSIQVPVWFFGEAATGRNAFLYARGGQKNDGWLPGEYLRSGTYVQVGAGFRL